MTLTPDDIHKIGDLYRRLAFLQRQRKDAAQVKIERADGYRRNGDAKSEFHTFDDFSAEAAEEIRNVIAHDLRRRAAAIVQTLHKYGCEATLTEE